MRITLHSSQIWFDSLTTSDIFNSATRACLLEAFLLQHLDLAEMSLTSSWIFRKCLLHFLIDFRELWLALPLDSPEASFMFVWKCFADSWSFWSLSLLVRIARLLSSTHRSIDSSVGRFPRVYINKSLFFARAFHWSIISWIENQPHYGEHVSSGPGTVRQCDILSSRSKTLFQIESFLIDSPLPCPSWANS